jgi:hypothetical protein
MIYGLIIVRTAKKSLMLDYGLSNTTFEPPNHAFTQKIKDMCYIGRWSSKIILILQHMGNHEVWNQLFMVEIEEMEVMDDVPQ